MHLLYGLMFFSVKFLIGMKHGLEYAMFCKEIFSMLKLYRDFIPMETFLDQEKKKETAYKAHIYNRLISYKQQYDRGLVPLPYVVFLETINRCNGHCPFCPASVGNERREFAIMEWELIKKILCELSQLNYSGQVAFSCNNEPFLDKRIVDILCYAREVLPNNHFYLYTNGTLLNPDLLSNVMRYLDEIMIDNYNDNYCYNQPIKIITDYVKENEDKFENKLIHIYFRKANDILSTRGGRAPNNNGQKQIYPLHNNYGCACPFQQLVITPSGKVSLCCSDAMGDMSMGDLNKMSIKDIWSGSTFQKVRNLLYDRRNDISLCKYCDFIWLA